MPSPDELLALASLAGNTVVAAAVTDAWETVRHGIGRVFGRGGGRRAEVAEQRLAETRGELTTLSGSEFASAQAKLVKQWAMRFADLLQEHPDVETDLRALVDQLLVEMPASSAIASDHAVAAARDVNIEASGGAVAAGVIQGDVTPGPFLPGPASG